MICGKLRIRCSPRSSSRLYTPEAHPKGQPFPYKRAVSSRGRLIRSSLRSRLTTPEMHPTNRPPLPIAISLFPSHRRRSPSVWTRTLNTMSPHRRQPLPRHSSKPPSLKGGSPPNRPSPSYKPSAQGGVLKSSSREVVQITSRTLFQSTQAYEATIRGLREDVADLQARIAATPVTPRIAPRPQGFLPNNSRLPHFFIPHLGGWALARFIRRCPADPTMAEGTMGGTGAKIYVYPLKALPPYDASGDGGENRAGEPLPMWLLNLLRGSETTFRLVLRASQATGDWGLPTDIAQYRSTVNRVNELHAACEGILDSLNSCWESLETSSPSSTGWGQAPPS